tara:strand:- start:3603 stop:4577 length:975 start_codon:yes stop_codon:yes gene_type:complete
MLKKIICRSCGGPDVMEYVDDDVGNPGLGEVRIVHKAIGLNYIDIYFRSGLYPLNLPSSLGMEASGVISAIGKNVTNFKIGDRVAYVARPPGSYCQERVMSETNLIKIPQSISFDIAAAMMLQGMTVQYLFNRTCNLKKGETILFHAAAGGVGLIAAQWAKKIGVKMIGTVGSEEKASLAKRFGCDMVINYKTENFVEKVRDLTNGKGVSVVYDSIGKDTFFDSLDCLSPLGTMVSFGSASGPVPSFSLNELASRGSLFITRPSLFNYAASKDEVEKMSSDVINMIQSENLKIEVNHRYALEDIQKAHEDLENRITTGSIILIP